MSIKIFRRGSGYTPITIPVLSRLVIIKLGIDNFLDVEKIIYQFSHELCHFIYYCLYGLREIAENKLFVPLHKCEKRSIKIDVS